MQNISDIFIDNLYGIVQKGINDDVRNQARLCLIDYVACAIGGSKLMEKENHNFFDIVVQQGGNVSVIGSDKKTTLHNAVYLQAMNVHATELDDGHRLGMIHLGASILSALLPVAEVESLTFDDVLLGVVIGYEAAIRTAMQVIPGIELFGVPVGVICLDDGRKCSMAYQIIDKLRTQW